MRLRSKPWLAAAALVVAGAAGCGGGERPTSVLLVTLDTTRADRIGCYGRANAGTPTLDTLAARGVRFERAYATVPVTLPSHASILTGTYPPYHGVRDNALYVLDGRIETLAEVFGRNGRRTGAFVSAVPVARRFGLDQGFEVYDDDLGAAAGGRGELRERAADVTAAAATRWLAKLGDDEAFFAWVHLFDPHRPLKAPQAFAERFPDDPYQAEIAFADAAVGELVAALEERGRLADTLVAVTSDHGEGLGEHGEDTHAVLLYDTTLRVPLILAGPGVESRPVALATPVSLVDLAPTLVELAGVPEEGAFRGRFATSLVPLWCTPAPGTLAARELYFESLFPRIHHGWSELFGLARGEWKYVEAPGASRAELFAPDSDPSEAQDLMAARGEVGRELSGRLRELRARIAEGGIRDARRELGQGDLEDLAALGYGGADVLAREDADGVRPGRDPREVIEAVTLIDVVRWRAGDGDFRGAQAALERLSALDPGGLALFEATGDLHLARGIRGSAEDLELASEAFRAAIELQPGRRGLWLRRAEALAGLGRLEEALGCIDRALELSPPTPEQLAAREDLVRRIEAGR